MSRCFPYPPPGYELKNGVHDLALIESIKREKEKTKKERRKEKKSEKKNKKEKSREDGDRKKKERSHKKKLKLDSKAGDSLKIREQETEQLEKSCLTEDQGQPAITQNLYDSSDSIKNSNKRKRHSSPHDINRTVGCSILIRLPLQKHKDPELPTSEEKVCSILERTSKEKVCSISGRTEIVPIKKDEISSSRACEQSSASTSGRNENGTQDTAVAVPPIPFSRSVHHGIDFQLREQIENWVPPTMQIELNDCDDQEWLFERNQQLRHEPKRSKPCSDIDLCQGSIGWPRACYLPDIDIYALPYTIPF